MYRAILFRKSGCDCTKQSKYKNISSELFWIGIRFSLWRAALNKAENFRFSRNAGIFFVIWGTIRFSRNSFSVNVLSIPIPCSSRLILGAFEKRANVKLVLLYPSVCLPFVFVSVYHIYRMDFCEILFKNVHYNLLL